MPKKTVTYRSSDNRCEVRLLSRTGRIEIHVDGKKVVDHGVNERMPQGRLTEGSWEIYTKRAACVCAVYWNGCSLRPRRDDDKLGKTMVRGFREVANEEATSTALPSTDEGSSS